MLFAILCGLSVFIAFIVLSFISNEVDFFLLGLFFGFIVTCVLIFSLQQNIKNMEYEITKTEIVFNEFIPGKVCATKSDNSIIIHDARNIYNVRIIKDYTIILEGKSEYTTYYRKKKGTFFRLGNSDYKEETLILVSDLNKLK